MVLLRVAHLWGLLTRPHPSVVSPVERVQARQLSGIIVCLAAILALSTILTLVVRPLNESTRVGAITMAVTSTLLFGLYLLSRTAHIRLTALLYWSLTFVSITVGSIINTDPTFAETSIAFYVLTIVVGATVLPPVPRVSFLTLALYSVVFTSIILTRDLLSQGQKLDLIILFLCMWLVTYFNVRMQEGTRKIILDQQAQMASYGKFAALGEMAAGVAHEINNPLAVINGQAELLRLDVDKNVFAPEALKDRAGKINEMVNRISRIISGLRSFARIDADDPMTAFPVGKLLDETLMFSGERLKNHGIRLELDRSAIAPDWEVECRHAQIVQVLVHLINNAADAVQTLADPWVRIEVTRENDRLTFKIIDGGKGIPRELSERVFHPFFTTKEVGKGTGLGLSIARGIAESHNATLSIDHEHANTCFLLEMPVRRA